MRTPGWLLIGSAALYLPLMVYADDSVVHTSVTIGGPASRPVAPVTHQQNYVSAISGAANTTKPTTAKPDSNGHASEKERKSLPAAPQPVAPLQPIVPIKPPLLHVVKYGERSRDVLLIQQILTRNKLLVVPRGQEGIFGPRTKTALVAYQKKKRLKQTGVIDAATLAALTKEL